MKKTILNISEMLLSALTFPLRFVKMFTDIAVLPDVEGNMHRIIYRYSMHENVCELIGPFFPYLAMAIAASVIILNAINIVLRKIALPSASGKECSIGSDTLRRTGKRIIPTSHGRRTTSNYERLLLSL